MPISLFVALAAIPAETNVQKPVIVTPPLVTTVMPASPRPPKAGEESPPIPKNYPGGWANTGDYPVKALQERREGISGFKVTVSSEGIVTDCTISESSGHADLDEATCANVTKRALFFPAQGKKGEPVSGKYANRVRWQIPIMSSSASPSIVRESFPRPPQIIKALELRVEKEDYPESALAAGEQGTSGFMLDIDSAGKVSNCSITNSSGSSALDQKACVLAAKWSFEPARDIDGKPTFGKSKHMLNWRLPKGTPSVSSFPLRTPTNPFEKEGSITLNLEFDDKGKLVDCALQSKGEFPLFGGRDIFSDRDCKKGFGRDIKPFLDANGQPEAKRVIVHLGIDHQDPEPARAKEVAGTQ